MEQLKSFFIKIRYCGFIVSAAAALFLTSSSLAWAAMDLSSSVTAQDLGISEPRLLPNSNFYFLKNLARGIEKFFTFDPLKKIDLELRFADEKILEAKLVSEKSPNDRPGLEKAIDNYRASQEDLKERRIQLGETSKNPNVDKLLEKIADRTVKHEQLFYELKEKFAGDQETQKNIDKTQDLLEESVIEATQNKAATAVIEAPSSGAPKSASEKDYQVPCDVFLSEYRQYQKDLEHGYLQMGPGKKADEQYRKSKEELERRYQECWDEIHGAYKNSQQKEAVPSSGPPPTRNEVKAMILKRCEELLRILKNPPSSMSFEEASDLEQEFIDLNCWKLLGLDKKNNRERVAAPTLPTKPIKPPKQIIRPRPIGDMFKIVTVKGYSARPIRGEGWNLMIDVREPDGTPAIPREGFNVQVYIAIPKVKTLFGGNAEFNGETWDLDVNVPKEDGSYRLSVSAYCGIDNSTCEKLYGRARQADWNFDFTIGDIFKPIISVPIQYVPPPKPAPSVNRCEELTKVLRDLKLQYQAGKITSEALDKIIGPYQEEESIVCQKTEEVAPVQKSAASPIRCDELNKILKDLKLQYQDGRISTDELDKLARPYQEEQQKVCPVVTGEQG